MTKTLPELNTINTDTNTIQIMVPEGGSPIKSWTNGVLFEDHAKHQLVNIAKLPFVYRHVAVMPDVHAGKGATVGSVIPTTGAIIPAAVGVDIGCGMVSVKTTLNASDLPDNVDKLRSAIEAAVPHGRSDNGGKNDRGAWGEPPMEVQAAWMGMEGAYRKLIDKTKKVSHFAPMSHLGTLGTGNHFIEVCLDEEQNVWIMLHSGSRGPGNRIGQVFIELAKEDMKKYYINLPDQELAYLPEGTDNFDNYIEAVHWAQEYAKVNRELMMDFTVKAMRKSKLLPKFELTDMAINCHHNYISREQHFGKNVWVTRKGAVLARKGVYGIIPGSMGAKSFIVKGLGNKESFDSCSHGAGRLMSRTEAKQRFTLKDHREATQGVSCRVDKDVIDETPKAYKPIEDVMNAQKDLIEVVATLKQILCVKG